MKKFYGILIKNIKIITIVIVLLILCSYFSSTSIQDDQKNKILKNSLNSNEYNVTFYERGLPPGQRWSIKVIINITENITYYSNTSVIKFSEVNGSYVYIANSSTSYASSEATGYMNISGESWSKNITFFRVSVSEFYQPYLLLNSSENKSFIFNPGQYQPGPSALNFGVMNTTMNFIVFCNGSLIYQKNITGAPTNFQNPLVLNSYGYVNFIADGQIKIFIMNNGKDSGYFSLDLYNYYISNYSASLITIPPHFAEYFGTGNIIPGPTISGIPNSTGISFTLVAPYYRQAVPLSIWISGGYYSPESKNYWWAQVGFNNWATYMYDVSYAGWGGFSNNDINGTGGTDTNYPLIPNMTYNFTMEAINNHTWQFFVNGQPIVEANVGSCMNTTTYMANYAYLGIELLGGQRAGQNMTSMFNGSIIIPNGLSYKVNGKWIKAKNFAFVSGGEDWEDGNGGGPAGFNLWGIEGNIQNKSIPSGEIILNNGRDYPFDIPSNVKDDVYPLYGNFSFPYENVSTYGNFINITQEENGTIKISPYQNNTLVSIMQFNGTSNYIYSDHNIIISKPVYVDNPAIDYRSAISAVPLNCSTSVHGYNGIFQEIVLKSYYNFSFSLGSINTSYMGNIDVPLYVNNKISFYNLTQVYSYDPNILEFNGIINTIATENSTFQFNSMGSGIIEIKGYNWFNAFYPNSVLFYLSFKPLIKRQFSTNILLDYSYVNNILIPGNSSASVQAFAGWENIGPSAVQIPNSSTPFSGLVSNVAYDYSNLSIIYAVSGQSYPFSGPIGYPGDTGFGGVYKSTDGGKTWLMKDLGLNSTSVTSIIVDQSNPNIVVVETRGLGNIVGGGIYKTINGGQSWQETYPLGGFSLQYLNGTLYATTFYSILKSYNFGTTWILVANFSKIVTASLILDNGKKIYVGLYNEFYESTSQPMPNVTDQVMESTNYGKSFVLLSNFTQSLFDGKLPSISQIIYDPANQQDLWALVDSPYNGREMGNPSLFRSFNGGLNWSLVNTSAVGMGYLPEPPDFITYDPVNSSIMYVAGNGYLFKSTNGGNTFFIVKSKSMPSVFYNMINIDPENDNILFLCSGNGLFESLDQGSNWTSMTNISTALLFDVAADDQNIFAISEGLSPPYSNDSGMTWTTINKGFGGIVSVDPYNSSIVIMWTETHTTAGGPFFFVSNNGGNSFFLPSINFTQEVNEFVNNIAFSKNQIFVPGGSGIFVSNNSGISWRLINNSPQYAFSIIDCPSSQNILYASNSTGLFISNNSGITWSKVNSIYLTFLAVDPLNASIIVGTLGYSGYNTYISYNSGQNFQLLNIGSNNYWSANSKVYFYNTSSGPLLIFTSSQGIFASYNFGKNWIDYSYNIPAPVITSFYLSQNGKAYVSTYGSGIWLDPDFLNFTTFKDVPILTGYLPSGLNLSINGINIEEQGFFYSVLKQGQNSIYAGKQLYLNATDGNVYFINFTSLQATLFLKAEGLPTNAIWHIEVGGNIYNIFGTGQIKLPFNVKMIYVFPVRSDYSIYYPEQNNFTLNLSLFSSLTVQFKQVEILNYENITSRMTGNFWTTQIAYNMGYVLYGGGGSLILLNTNNLSIKEIENPSAQVFSISGYKNGFLIGGTISQYRPGLFYYNISSGAMENLSYYFPSGWQGNYMKLSTFVINNYSFGFIGGGSNVLFFGLVDNGTLENLTQYLPFYFVPNNIYSASYISSEKAVLISNGIYFGMFYLNNFTYHDLTGSLPYQVGIGIPYWTPSSSFIASNGNEFIIIGSHCTNGTPFVGLYSKSKGLLDISNIFSNIEYFDTVTWSGHDFVLSGMMLNNSAPFVYLYNASANSLTLISTSIFGNVSLIDSAIIHNSTLYFTSFNSRQEQYYSVLYSYYGIVDLTPTGQIILRTNVPSYIRIGNLSYFGKDFQIPAFPGSYNITISSPGYSNYSFIEKVNPYETAYLNVTLKKLYFLNFTESGLHQAHHGQ